MALDLSQFTGTAPYGSELFGVYQPLLGWKSRLKKIRFNKDIYHALDGVLDRIAKVGPSLAEVRKNPTLLLADNLPPASVPHQLNTVGTRKLADAVSGFKQTNGHLPSDTEWSKVLQTADLTSVVAGVASSEAQRSAPYDGKFSSKHEAIVGGMWQ